MGNRCIFREKRGDDKAEGLSLMSLLVRLTVVMLWMLEWRLSLTLELRQMMYFCAWLANYIGVEADVPSVPGSSTLSHQENRILGEVEEQIEQTLAKVFENYKSLDDSICWV